MAGEARNEKNKAVKALNPQLKIIQNRFFASYKRITIFAMIGKNNNLFFFAFFVLGCLF
jgi:hypothetical protein